MIFAHVAFFCCINNWVEVWLLVSAVIYMPIDRERVYAVYKIWVTDLIQPEAIVLSMYLRLFFFAWMSFQSILLDYVLIFVWVARTSVDLRFKSNYWTHALFTLSASNIVFVSWFDQFSKYIFTIQGSTFKSFWCDFVNCFVDDSTKSC